jgi:hypothetical protein
MNSIESQLAKAHNDLKSITSREEASKLVRKMIKKGLSHGLNIKNITSYLINGKPIYYEIKGFPCISTTIMSGSTCGETRDGDVEKIDKVLNIFDKIERAKYAI